MISRKILALGAFALLLTSTMAFTQATGKTEKAGKAATLTGVVSDSMCGPKHMMPDKSAAECTRACVKGGSDYVLMVGKKMYTLRGNAAELDKYAGERVTVKGNLTGSIVTVESVTPAGANGKKS